jgi:hypothetical protein
MTEAEIREYIFKNKLGIDPTETALPKTIADYVAQWVTEISQAFRTELETLTTKKQSQLGLSIQPDEVSQIGTVVLTRIKAEDYWEFVNAGVTGIGGFEASKKHPSHYSSGTKFTSTEGFQFKNVNTHPQMVRSLKEWLPSTGLLGGLSSKTYDSVVFGMAKNIKRRGLKPRPFVDNVINDNLLQKIASGLEDLTGNTFIVMFEDFESKSKRKK